jgi:uncharacterized protein (TIGR02996 family)
MDPRTTEDRLLAGIVAAPDEDACRLVYADWLLSSGKDPARGELIQVQCASPTDAHRDRESALLSEGEQRWLRPLEPFYVPQGERLLYHPPPRFERGFVATMNTEAASLTLDAASELVRWPITRVALYHGRQVAPAHLLALLPRRFPALRELYFREAALDEAGACALRDTPPPGLRVLQLGDASVSEQTLASLSSAPVFGQLETLQLSCRISAATVAGSLARAVSLRRLEGGELDDAAVLALAQHPSFGRLEAISSRVSPTGLLAIVTSPTLVSLRSLPSYSRAYLGPQVAAAVEARLGSGFLF